MREISILYLGAGQQLCYAQSMGWAPASPMHEQPAMHHGHVRPAAFQGGMGSSCSERQQGARLFSLDVTEEECPDLWLMSGKISLSHLWQHSPTSLARWAQGHYCLPHSRVWERALCGPAVAPRGYSSFSVLSRATDESHDPGLPLVPRPWEQVLRTTRAAGLPCPLQLPNIGRLGCL